MNDKEAVTKTNWGGTGSLPASVFEDLGIAMTGNRKRVRHYHEPGDFHELTFSCYQQFPLLANDGWSEQLCRQIDKATERYQMRLVAFVLMPDHVHLLVYPELNKPDIEGFLSAVKRPFSFRIKQQLLETRDDLLEKLTVRERPGKMAFPFCQEGPGYDRNLNSTKVVLASIGYLHENPIRRQLCANICDWKWSSARWYASDRSDVDPVLPVIHGVPVGFDAGE